MASWQTCFWPLHPLVTKHKTAACHPNNLSNDLTFERIKKVQPYFMIFRIVIQDSKRSIVHSILLIQYLWLINNMSKLKNLIFSKPESERKMMLNFLRSYNEKDRSKKETGLEHHHMDSVSMHKKLNKFCC